MPYKILAKIGKVVYKIELLEEDRIHTVFHVSHLKPFHEDSTIHSTALPTQFNEGQPLIRPFHILNTRVVLQDDKHITHVLVQWEGLLSEDASWVSSQDLQKSYPDFDLEDKVSLKEGRNDVNQKGIEEELPEEKHVSQRIKSG